MKRLTRLIAGLAAACTVAVTTATGASAQTQQIDCHTNALDITAEQGVYSDTLEYSIGLVHKVAPDADVYAQAYEYLPGGSAEAFWELGLKQCKNWVHPEFPDRPKDNILLVVYGHDVDDIGLFYGFGFEAVVYQKHEDIMKAIGYSIGPELSKKRLGYAGGAMAQALRDSRKLAEKSNYYSKVDGKYNMPRYAEPKGYTPTDWNQTVLVMILVAGGFLATGVGLWILQTAYRAYRRRG